MVRQSQDAALLLKIPYFDSVVPRSRRERNPRRMEVHTRHPVLVSLAAHYQITGRHVPHLPGLVVTGSDKDGLGRVDGQVGDREEVALGVGKRGSDLIPPP